MEFYGNHGRLPSLQLANPLKYRHLYNPWTAIPSIRNQQVASSSLAGGSRTNPDIF